MFATTSESEGPIEVIIERPTEEGLPQELVTEKQLTEAELNSAAGTEERKRGIAKMRANGFQSQHEHGNAIDFSYPFGYSKDNFEQLKSEIAELHEDQKGMASKFGE